MVLNFRIQMSCCKYIQLRCFNFEAVLCFLKLYISWWWWKPAKWNGNGDREYRRRVSTMISNEISVQKSEWYACIFSTLGNVYQRIENFHLFFENNSNVVFWNDRMPALASLLNENTLRCKSCLALLLHTNFVTSSFDYILKTLFPIGFNATVRVSPVVFSRH
jgi:hypothetical protein